MCCYYLSWRHFINDVRACNFYINGKLIENVSVCMTLILATSLIILISLMTTTYYIIANSFVGQAIIMLCLLNNQDILIRLKIFQSFCSRFYGCELWSLNITATDVMCAACCKALRRVLKRPYSHSYLLPILNVHFLHLNSKRLLNALPASV